MVPRSMCKSDAEFFEMLRDDFAAKAMQGLLASDNDSSECWSDTHMRPQTAKVAYAIADAMLAARDA